MAKDLSSPMTQTWPAPGKGGNQPGDKEAWGVMQSLGAGAPAKDEPGLQITVDLEGAKKPGSTMPFPSGTAMKP